MLRKELRHPFARHAPPDQLAYAEQEQRFANCKE
jgi:hypothetical protein